MKTRIKIASILGISFILVNFFLRDADTPSKLQAKVEAVVNHAREIAGLIDKNNPNIANTNFNVTTVVPLVKSAKAEEERFVMYKGKRLKIYTNDPNAPLSEETLEFMYQIQLKREVQGIE